MMRILSGTAARFSDSEKIALLRYTQSRHNQGLLNSTKSQALGVNRRFIRAVISVIASEKLDRTQNFTEVADIKWIRFVSDFSVCEARKH